MFLVVIDIGVGVHTLHFHFVFFTSIPVYGALDFTFEMSWESGWNKSHLNVLVRVGLQVTAHWLKLKIVSAHQAWFLKFKLEFLSGTEIVQYNKSIWGLAALKLTEINGFIWKCCLLAFLSKVSSTVGEIFIKVNFYFQIFYK